MATFKRTAGGWQAQVAIRGVREAKTCSTKAEAVAWAAERETQLRKMAETGVNTDKTCRDAFERYIKEVSAHKRGKVFEERRLSVFAEQRLGKLTIGDTPIHAVTSDMLGKWRDDRLKTVSGSTVNREFNLLSNVFSTVLKEWKWIAKNPASDVRRPKESAPRDRLISQSEIEAIIFAADFKESIASTVQERVCIAFLFALETAMRAGEIVGLPADEITGSVAHLGSTKNGTARDVPLSPRAIELLSFLPASAKPDAPIFGLSSSQLDANFRKLRDMAMVDGLTFHDTRHEAITRLARKLNVLELARMVGHRDLKMLQIYYNETAAEIAKKLV